MFLYANSIIHYVVRCLKVKGIYSIRLLRVFPNYDFKHFITVKVEYIPTICVRLKLYGKLIF